MPSRYIYSTKRRNFDKSNWNLILQKEKSCRALVCPPSEASNCRSPYKSCRKRPNCDLRVLLKKKRCIKKIPAEDYRAKKDGDGLVDERLVLLQSQQEPRKVLLYISDIKEATNHQLAWRTRGLRCSGCAAPYLPRYLKRKIKALSNCGFWKKRLAFLLAEAVSDDKSSLALENEVCCYVVVSTTTNKTEEKTMRLQGLPNKG